MHLNLMMLDVAWYPYPTKCGRHGGMAHAILEFKTILETVLEGAWPSFKLKM